MTKITDWLSQGIRTLKTAGIESARLDCLIILEDALDQTRIKVLSNLDYEIPNVALTHLDKMLERRKSREPLAYIRSSVEFYGRDFFVNPSVLIPRPESESIIEIAKTLPFISGATIADVGTGSGALAVTISLEIPDSTVIAYDIDSAALEVARKNNVRFNSGVEFIQDDLLHESASTFDCIIANLPYVSRSQPVSIETIFEPSLSLFADDDGLALIKQLIEQITTRPNMKPGGYLILESEPRQHVAIRSFAEDHSLKHVKTENFIQLFQYSD